MRDADFCNPHILSEVFVSWRVAPTYGDLMLLQEGSELITERTIA